MLVCDVARLGPPRVPADGTSGKMTELLLQGALPIYGLKLAALKYVPVGVPIMARWVKNPAVAAWVSAEAWVQSPSWYSKGFGIAAAVA